MVRAVFCPAKCEWREPDEDLVAAASWVTAAKLGIELDVGIAEIDLKDRSELAIHLVYLRGDVEETTSVKLSEIIDDLFDWHGGFDAIKNGKTLGVDERATMTAVANLLEIESARIRRMLSKTS